MCRFFAYMGSNALMHDAMFNAENSLIEQSKSAKKRRCPVNGDGFGIGWYPAHEDFEPGCFVATTPAWSDQNLRNLCKKILTPLFFAHIRDASHGMPVSSTNCHPFIYGNFMWMHNGYIENFNNIKRQVIGLLSDKAFLQIRGNTDSEFAFALFLDAIQFNHDASLEQIETAILVTISTICNLQQEVDPQAVTLLNFVVSNGKLLVATRFSKDINYQPPSLFYTQAEMGFDEKSVLKLVVNSQSKSLIISSEPITNDQSSWLKVDRNHMVSCDNFSVPQIKAIN